MVYGSALSTLTGSFDPTQFVNGDSPPDVAVPTLTTTATSRSGVGSYPITGNNTVRGTTPAATRSR
jgi:hypothetical protein